jgi:hypothetical protein
MTASFIPSKKIHCYPGRISGLRDKLGIWFALLDKCRRRGCNPDRKTAAQSRFILLSPELKFSNKGGTD